MKPITHQQRLYAEARASGRAKKEAAVIAGYPEKTASQAASRLEKNKKILDHWARIGFKPHEQEKPRAEKPVKKEKPESKAEQKKEIVVTKEPEPEPELVNGPDPSILIGALASRAKEIIDRKEYGDVALSLLMELALDEAEDPRLRADSAKYLAKHSLEISKKASAKDKQQEAAKEASNRFAPSKAPLKAVK